MEIRAATADDLDALVALNAEVQRHHVVLEPTEYLSVELRVLRAVLKTRLMEDQWEISIACLDGVGVGYICWTHSTREETPYTPARSDLYVDQLGVSSIVRGQGIGRALMAAAEERARDLGCNRVQLDVRVQNTEAAAFYEALDYTSLKVLMSRPISKMDPT